MQICLYGALGRLSLIFDYLLRVFSRKGLKDGCYFDKTGILFRSSKEAKILFKDSACLVADFGRISHSFWRAQELSLFLIHRELVKYPLLDFGCGDGSFSSILFKHIDYGVDYDPEALEIAKGSHIYDKLIQSQGGIIPLECNAVSTVISNSALEHVVELDKALSEIYRILRYGGYLILTVPILNFKDHLSKYFGENESRRVNSEYFHRNLLSKEDWAWMLEKNKFSILKILEYQPELFTFYYRMLRLLGTEKGLGRIIPNMNRKIWNLAHKKFINTIKSSITNTKDGANIFVIAIK